MSRTHDMTQEEAKMFVAYLVESIKKTMQAIVSVADEYGLYVQILDEWDNRLTYTGRPYLDEDSDYKADGGWYSSHC